MIKKNLFLLIVFVSFFIPNLSAQTDVSWEEYGIGFTLPDGFSVTDNSSEQFSAAGNGMQMFIRPFSDDSIDDEDITAYVIDIAESLDLDGIEAVDVVEVNGFTGGYAEGTKNGKKVFVMGLIDPDSETNFFVMIAFGNDDEEAVGKAQDICNSLHKL